MMTLSDLDSSLRWNDKVGMLEFQAEDFFSIGSDPDKLVDTPADHPQDLLCRAYDGDTAAPGLRYPGINHKLVQFLGLLHTQRLEAVTGKAVEA